MLLLFSFFLFFCPCDCVGLGICKPSILVPKQQEIFHKTNQHLFGLILHISYPMKSGLLVECEGQFRCEEEGSSYRCSSLSMIFVMKEGKLSHGVSSMLTARCIEIFETLDWYSFRFLILK